MKTAAPRHAALSMASTVRLPVTGIVRYAGTMFAAWRSRAAMRRQQRLLAALDPRILKDLALHRSEAGSAAAELAGYAEPSRRLSRTH